MATTATTTATTEETEVKEAPKAKKAPKIEGSNTDLGSFAVIKTGGKQFRVSEGTSIKIEVMPGEHKVGDTITFNEVLLVDNGTETKVGTPTVSGAKVTGELTQISRYAKVVVMRYKQKSRSGPTKNGHRQTYFKVKILSI